MKVQSDCAYGAQRTHRKPSCSASPHSNVFRSRNTNVHSVITQDEHLKPSWLHFIIRNVGSWYHSPQIRRLVYRWTWDSGGPGTVLLWAFPGWRWWGLSQGVWMWKLLAAGFSVGRKRGPTEEAVALPETGSLSPPQFRTTDPSIIQTKVHRQWLQGKGEHFSRLLPM